MSPDLQRRNPARITIGIDPSRGRAAAEGKAARCECRTLAETRVLSSRQSALSPGKQALATPSVSPF